MSSLRRLIAAEAWKMLRDPRRFREAFRPRRWRQLFGIARFQVRGGDRWTADPRGFQNRAYSGYGQYLDHQRGKLAYLDLATYEEHYARLLQGRLAPQARLKPGAFVLCLGARRGAEVRAFRGLGCRALGLDLNPGPDNPEVLCADFHAIPVRDGAADAVFTNSLDHVFEVDRFIGEIRRVLKPEGHLVIEAIRGRDEGTAPDAYASFWWNRVDDVVALFEMRAFKLRHRSPFNEPWPGEQLVFQKVDAGGVGRVK